MKFVDNIKSIIFDFDGTLHDTIKIYFPAFSKGADYLKSLGYAQDFEVTEENIQKFLGEKPSFAYELIAKGASDEIKAKTQRMVGLSMEENMKNKLGKLYPNTIEVLETLSQKYDLYILSNARERYLDKALEIYNIKKYFKDTFAAETYNYQTKDKILEQILPNIEKEVIFVGDRFHDIDAAVANNIKSIFCKYGFGSVKEGEKSNFTINNLTEILEIL